MPRKKSNKPLLTELKQAHAKIETLEPTSLEQVWSNSSESKYGTLDENIYGQRLKEMTRSDLENEAIRQGLVLVESDRLRDKLLNIFRTYISTLKRPVQTKSTIKVTPEVQKILNEGR